MTPTDQETMPAAIFARHAHLVRRFFACWPGSSTEVASAVLCLPRSVVERHLEMTPTPLPYGKRRNKRTQEQREKMFQQTNRRVG